MQIRSLANIDFETIFEAFNKAFADYEIQFDSIQLQAMLKRRGFSPGLSFAAFEDDKIVAFTLNGIGNFNGAPTVYDTGTGTLKTHRGKGIATQIFEYSIPYLREANVKQYLLEVLQHNTKAVSVYKNLGFEVTREFNYFIQHNEDIRFESTTTDEFFIQQIDITRINELADFWDFCPSWQNGFESIQRASDGFVCLGAFVGNEIVGYCVFEPISGDVTQKAVDKKHRRKGIATLLLQEMLKLNTFNSIKVLNTDIRCSSITDFLKTKNFAVTGKQFEMIRNI